MTGKAANGFHDSRIVSKSKSFGAQLCRNSAEGGGRLKGRMYSSTFGMLAALVLNPDCTRNRLVTSVMAWLRQLVQGVLLAGVIVNPVGVRGVLFANFNSSVHPSSELWYLTYSLLP